jgi:voltage-gated potassium channel Kch
VVEEAKSWFRDNSTLIYFLIAQFIAIGAGAASILAYAVKLETRVHIMETRGAEYTVARMEEIRRRITVLEGDIENNKDSIKRVIDIMTRELGKDPRRTTP